MKRLADAAAVIGILAGVLALGTLMTGWWGLSPWALMAAGLLLITGAVLGALAGRFEE